MRKFSPLVIVFIVVLLNSVKISYGAQSNPKPELLYIGKNDLSDCHKYICIDSSGFYYLYCDSVIAGKQRQKRIELDKYVEEKAFLYAIDTSDFDLNNDLLFNSGCGLSKGNFEIYAEIDHQQYNKHLALVSGCDSTSPYYKIQLINNFFNKIEFDLKIQNVLELLPYYIKHNDTNETVKGCDSGYYQLIGDDKVLRIGVSVVSTSQPKIIIDSTSDIELLIFKKGYAKLVNFCSYGVYSNPFQPIKRIKVKSGIIDGIIVENKFDINEDKNYTTILINKLEFKDSTTGSRYLIIEGLFYKTLKINGL